MNAYQILDLPVGTRRSMFVKIDPPTAAKLLATQELADVETANRKPSDTKIKIWADSMRDGLWETNGETIVFDPDGYLIDGQHRLAGLASLDGLDITIEFLAVLGIERSAQKTMDQGVLRRLPGKLSLEGYSNATVLASVAKHLFHADLTSDFTATQERTVSDSHAFVYVEEHFDEIERSFEHLDTAKRLTRSPMLYLTAFITLSRIDADDAREFFESLRTGANLPEGSPIYTLREKFMEMKIDTKRSVNAEYRRDQLAFTYHAWNAFRSGRELRKLRRPNGGVWTAENFPTPV